MNLFKFLREDDPKEFTTLPRTFEKYRWFLPIIIVILAYIINLALNFVLMSSATTLYPQFSRYNADMVTYSIESLVGMLGVALMAVSLYIPIRLLYRHKISSVKGWRWDILFKTALVSLIAFGLFSIIQALIWKASFVNHFTVLTFILCLIITPFQCFAEEYVFRAFFMQTFGSWFRIPILAIIIQAVLFTMSHGYNVLGIAEALVFGIVIGLMTWYTKGIEFSSAVHWINNLVLFLSMGFGLQNYTMNVTLWDSVTGILLTLIISAAVLLIERKWAWFGFNKESES